MKTKLLKRLRKKAKNTIVLIQTDKYGYEIRRLFDDITFKTLVYIGGAFDEDYFMERVNEYRRDYILEKIKGIRKSIYPKTIDI